MVSVIGVVRSHLAAGLQPRAASTHCGRIAPWHRTLRARLGEEQVDHQQDRRSPRSTETFASSWPRHMLVPEEPAKARFEKWPLWAVVAAKILEVHESSHL